VSDGKTRNLKELRRCTEADETRESPDAATATTADPTSSPDGASPSASGALLVVEF